VGYSYVPGQGTRTLTEHWDGSTWTLVDSPNPTTAGGVVTNVSLNAVGCTSASDCWALGSTASDNVFGAANNVTLIEHWDGRSWTVLPAPSIGWIFGVACLAGSDCWAVGAVGLNNVGLAEHWDGSFWSVVSSANGAVAPYNVPVQLTGMACSSTSDCWAAGYETYRPVGILSGTVEHWDGMSWKAARVADTDYSRLFDITCPSASNCWAVGWY